MTQLNPSSPHRLLRTLNELVRSDGGPAKFKGNIVVAVKGLDGVHYWHASFEKGRLLGCGYLAGLPPDAHAIMLFEDEQATDVLIGDSPQGKITTYGDHELLTAFVKRYCEFQSLVDILASR